ncbi:transcriptional regulator, TetR family [Pseudovibrio denitrificans]|uniref:Transcriptional regulator, TetR family n=1 Tax=Pseudovibrio denitrificans TaxID=258256 RepID=A0A1I6XVT0_9HYPH|nr:TetR/AcrR family transcriptional regulator [Pseudovibrio denitrificans]SFT42410.1 transcriptional regulator, TetR family [Pseudovibrio denitrificans]
MKSCDKIVDGKVTPEIENLFDQCVKVFLLKGYETSTLEEIAEAGGCTPECIKEHFSTKEELTAAAMRWYYIKYSRQMRAEMAMHQDIYSAMEAVLFAFIEISCDQVHANKGLFVRTFIDIAYVDDVVKKSFEDLQDDWEVQVLDKFNQCKDELKDPSEVEALAHYFLTVIEGLYELIKYGTPCELMYKVAIMSLDTLEVRMKHGQPKKKKGSKKKAK